MKIDPAKITKYSKEELVNFYVEARDRQGVLEATRKEIGKELLSRMKTDGEVIDRYALTKAKKINFKVDLEQARELGATEEKVSNSALKKLYNKGVKIAHEVVEYLMVREIEERGYTKRGVPPDQQDLKAKK